jgi:hypothetical protein
MPRQNRVTPRGDLIAVPDRGMFLGFRGPLLNPAGELARFSSGRQWGICALEFKGRRRRQWVPGRITELYFLDEATGLAAGHRPCGECRYRDYQAFKRAWQAAFPRQAAGAPAIDDRLHADRLAGTGTRLGDLGTRLVGAGTRRTYRADLTALPDGVMIETRDGRPWLLHDGELLAWSPGGYTAREPAAHKEEEVTVITPRATVAVLAAGYRPVLHPTATSPAAPGERRR